MITATVSDYRGCESANLGIYTITLIAGKNANGKSSLMGAIAAALTCQIMPDGVAKKDAATLVRDGISSAAVTLIGEDGRSSVTWPAAECASEGRPPRGSVYAAGIAFILDLSDKDRSAALGKYLKSEPTLADLIRSMLNAGIKLDHTSGAATQPVADAMTKLGLNWQEGRHVETYLTAEHIWRTEVEASGWDAAHKQMSADLAANKGKWEHVTGQKRYGIKIAASWIPDGWTEDLARADERNLREDVDVAKSALERAAGGAAIAVANRSKLADLAGKLADREREESDASNAVKLANLVVGGLYGNAPQALTPALECPHCGCLVSLSGGTLNPASRTPSATEIAAAKKSLAEHQAKVAKAARDHDAAVKSHYAAQSRVNEARDATDKLKAMPDTVATDETAGARAMVANAELRLAAAVAWREASRLHRRAVAMQIVVDILAPNGLRKSKMADVIGAFNTSILAPLCDAAKWSAVAMGEDLSLSYGGRPYPLLSVSERFRVRATMQVAMAQLDKSDLLLIDGADVLDAGGRIGLIRLLRYAQIPAAIGMTQLAPEKAFDLGARGLGMTYWIEGGVCRLLAECTAKKEAA